MANLSFWRPLMNNSIRGSIKRSPIVKDSLCDFSPMQHWSVYLTMSHESNWGPSAWTISVCLDRETAEWSSGEEVGPVPSDERFSISVKGYVRENIENHEPSERRICHQLIRQNSKHIGKSENSVLLDPESFLGDIIDSIILNKISTNVSDHVAGCICYKET